MAKSKCGSRSSAPATSASAKAPGKPGKASKSEEPTPAPTKAPRKVTTTKGGKVTVPSAAATTPEPTGKGKGRKVVTVAANATSAPPTPTKGRKAKEEATPVLAEMVKREKRGAKKAEAPPAPAKKGKASAQPAAAPPALREVKWTDERITVFRTMRRLKATSPGRARTAEDIAIEAEVTPFRVKEIGYRGNSTRGQIGKDASPFVLHGLIAVADASQVATDYAAGGRGLCYYLTEEGAKIVLPGDKAPRKK